MTNPSRERPPRHPAAGGRGSAGGAGGGRLAGPERLLTGAMLVLAILFAVGGAAQVGLAVFFLVRGDPVVHLPPEQPSEELSISLGGWLPLGALGVVMLALAWVTLRARRSSRREAGATG